MINIKKIVMSKWSKHFLQLSMLFSFGVMVYIILFVGWAKTNIDEICEVIFIVSIESCIIRGHLIEYWQSHCAEKEKREDDAI